ncbi:MAG: carboxylate-amine ligase [Actinobacteria bacterium]|nr:carboxylate-amine ligase [Actinomycetota bacterium]
MGAAGSGDPFERIQRERLAQAWRADRPGSTESHVVIALPSYSVDRSVYEHYGARIGPLEHRYLYAILRTQQPGTRVLYLSSRPVPIEVVEGYVALAPPEARGVVRHNSLLLSPHDPSPRPLADKVLDHSELLQAVRRFIGDEPALIEPWNVTEAERDLAVALDVPINGTDPARRSLATKSGGRKLFAAAGVRTPLGVEHVRSPAEVAAAVSVLRAARPGLTGVVVKLDDSVAGDGNIVLRFDGLPLDEHHGVDDLVRRSLPDWYVGVLAKGGIVEELIEGDDFCSPSGQADIWPDGQVEVLSTHDQRLGGPNGQVFEGCTFPARDQYAAEIGVAVRKTGEALAAEGAIGRFAVDFAAVREGSRWALFALEINLRKGGTTHPFGITRLLTGGRYDAAHGGLLLSDGSTRCYGATDNLVDERWRDRSPAEVRNRLAAAGVGFDAAARVGVIPHLLDCLAVDGRMGYTAVGRSREEVADLEDRVARALRSPRSL